MKAAVAASFAAAFVGTSAQNIGVIDFNLLTSLAPELSTAKPIPTSTTNTQSVASSIQSQLKAAHGSTATTTLKTMPNKPLKSTTKKAKTTHPKTVKPKTTLKKKTSKKTTKKVTTKKHTHGHAKRQATATTTSAANGACVSQSIYYTYVPSPNTPNGFLTDNNLRVIAQNALAPAGLTQSFSGQYASLFANNYLGYIQQTNYNVSECAALCAAYSGCTAINTYFERDPVVNPGTGCDNPNSGVSVRCALWGSSVNAAQALNIGEWRTNFMVVIQGSNGYNVNTPPAAQTNFTGPQALAGGIATSAGTSFLSSSFQSGAYDPSFCASACQSTTQQNYNAAVAAVNSTYAACNYFNTFKVSYNGTAAGTYCKLYTDSSVTNFANQYNTTTSNGVNYDITYSYGYSLTTNDTGVVPSAVLASASASRAAAQASKTASSTSAGATASQTPASANLVASCSQINSTGTFVDSNNITYKIKCGYDLVNAGDLSNRQVSSFAACFAACDNVSGCQAIAYVGGSGSGVCYFKSLTKVTQQPNANANVDLGWLPSAYPAYKGS